MTEAVPVLGRIVLGAVFLAAGTAKLIDREEFEKNLPNLTGRLLSRMFPAGVTSFAIPVMEVAVGCTLILGFAQRAAAMMAAVLLLAFSAVLVGALLRGVSASCGCFGQVGRGKVTGATVARNMILFVLAVAVATLPEMLAAPPLAALSLGITVALGILLGVQYLAVRADFLPLPVPPHQSGIRWNYVEPSTGWRSPYGLRGWLGTLAARLARKKDANAKTAAGEAVAG